MSLLEPTDKNLNEDSILSGQKCKTMTLVSRNIRYMRILMGVPWVGVSNKGRVVKASYLYVSISRTRYNQSYYY